MGQPIRVLHVDDQPEFVDLTKTVLEREDERLVVETATSASDGLDRLSDDIDCVVSDYDMPGTNGIEFLSAVREEYPTLPFVLFTGKGSEEVASEAIRRGATDYLQKQSGTDQYTVLANRVTNAVQQYRAKRDVATQERINAVVREVNEALVRATSHAEINDRVCEILSEADPYLAVWIGEHDGDTDRIEPLATAGDAAAYLEEVTVTADDSPTGQGPGGRAVRERRVAVSQNLRDDPAFEPWREAAIEHGFRAVAAIPLEYEETLYGLLAVYADEPDAFDDDERALLAQLGETIGHAHHRVHIQDQYEDQYRELFEQAPVMFAFTREEDGEPIIEDCNRQFADKLGYDRDQLRGRPLADVYTEASTQALLEGAGYERALTGEFVREERTFVTRDGEHLRTLLRATPRRNQEGEIVGTHALFVDISEEERTRELERIYDRMEFALDATDSVIFETDFASRSEIRHGPFERLFGVPSAEISTAEEFYDRCVHPDDRERVERLQQPVALGDDETVAYEFRTHPDCGEVRWIRSEAYVVTDEGGDPRRLVGLDTDVTERERHERELERQNERLEAFASVVSHDLRNPLNVAELRLDLVADECESAHIEDVEQAHERMRTLIEDLLTVARSGGTVDELEPVEFGTLARQCWNTVATSEASLVVETDRTIRADRDRFRQLLENLIRNVIDHGGTEVTATIGDLDDGFYVADDGPGIPEGNRDQIFEYGYSTAGEGVGLGLAIVQEIVDAHGWEISVTASAEGGARFEITGVETVA